MTHRAPNEISRASPGSIFHFEFVVIPNFWAKFGPQARALAGFAKNDGLGQVKYGGLEFVRGTGPNFGIVSFFEASFFEF